MFITSYGLFWNRDEVMWHPGQGARKVFRLLGRDGVNAPNISLADFTNQKGIYILYGNYGPYYVGITKKKGFGRRLKDHCMNQHSGNWDRFSWFGFCHVQKATEADGIRKVKPDLALTKSGSPSQTITDTEALLIRVMGLSNINTTKFKSAKEWIQIKVDEVEKYKAKVR